MQNFARNSFMSACLVIPLAMASPAVAADINPLESPAVGQPHQPGDGDEALRLLRAGDPKRALEKLTQLKAERPELGEPHTLLAQLYLALNQLAAARQELERAVVDNPNAPEAYLMFAEIALREQRLTDAQSLLDRAWALSQSFNENADRKKSASIRCQSGLAMVAELRGQWSDALDHLKAWEAIDSANGPLHQRLGRALFQLKKYNEALAELRRASKEEKKLLPADIVMAQLYEGAGDHKQAAQYIAQAVKTSPDDLQTRLAAAEWALKTNEIAKAKAEVEAIAKLDPDGITTNFLRGSIARVEHKLPEAERYFQAVHLKSPGNFAATNNLALVLIEEADETKRQSALEYATLNAEKYSQVPEAWSTLAWVYYQLKRYNEAEKAMERALSFHSLNPDSAFFLGTMLERSGKRKEAQAVLEQSLKTPEAFAYRQEVAALLAKVKKENEGATGGGLVPLDLDSIEGDTTASPAATQTPKSSTRPTPKPAPKAKP